MYKLVPDWLAPALLVAGVLLSSVAQAQMVLERPETGYYSKARVEFAFDDRTHVRLDGTDFSSDLKWDYAEIEALLKQYHAQDIERLFAEHSERLLDEMRRKGEARTGQRLPNLNNWYTCVLQSEEAARKLAGELSHKRHIRSASAIGVPVMMAADIAPTTPHYESYQDYFDAAPTGVGIATAWAQTNGTGEGISICHVEGGWYVDHEDFDLVYLGGGNMSTTSWKNHGTACVSILAAVRNAYGVTGLAYGTDEISCSGIDDGSASAWIRASNHLEEGDIIAASWGYGGDLPDGYSCSCNPLQAGSQPAESNQSDFDAIQTVSANGRIVVNSAANGCVPMDHDFYDDIYDLSNRDSGALIIGASETDRDPACFTNYGSRIDAFAWGESIYSAGYGDLFDGGDDTRQYYTSDFGGTSGACPIVAGSIATLQAIYKNRNSGNTMDAWQLRNLLRTTGTPQASASSTKPISNMPDLEDLVAAIGGGAPDTDPPSVLHTPLANQSQAGPWTVSAQITDMSGVASASLHWQLNGGTWNTLNMSGVGSTYSAAIPDQTEGSVITYYIVAIDGADTPNTATTSSWSFTVLSTASGIVLLTPSESALSDGAAWISALEAAGYTGVIQNVDNLDNVALGEDTDALIVLLGIYGDNHVLSENGEMALAIESYLQSGGLVYMEGGDCWAYDPLHGGHDFNSDFGITGEEDGTSDLVDVVGHAPLSGSWSYTGANSWIDRIASTGASLLFSNDSVGYNCGYYQNGSLRTVAASFELAGLDGFDAVVASLFGADLFNIIYVDPCTVDAEGPAITHAPLEDIVYSTSSRLVSAEISDPCGLSQVLLRWRVNGSNWTTRDMVEGGGYWQESIPPYVIGTIVEYEILATDASDGLNSSSFAGSYTILDPCDFDTTDPFITHTPLSDTSDTSGPYTVYAELYDNCGIDQGVLDYRVDEGSWTNAVFTNSGGTGWIGLIPGQPTGGLVEYRITARDQSSNEVQESWSFNVLYTPDPPSLSYNPVSVSGSADIGDSDSVTITLQNIGEEMLDWSAAISEDPLPTMGPRQVFAPVELAKGEDDPRPPMQANRGGGPDGGGYSWSDSSDPAGPAIAFVDISSSGTALAFEDDDNSGPLSLGFTVSFYGESYTTVNVCSNGWLSFTSTETDYANQGIPSPDDVDALIAPMWDDFNPEDGGEVYYEAQAGRFIVQWDAVPRYNEDGSACTFEAILHEDGCVEFQYADLSATTNSATVGIENASGSIGTQLVFSGDYLSSNMAVLFERSATTWLSVSQSGGALTQGEQGSLDVIMDATELTAGSYTGQITLTTNEPGRTLEHLIPVSFVVSSPDSDAPMIEHDCLGDVYESQVRSVSAEISDASTVDYATLFWNLGSYWEQADMSHAAGDTWTANLPAVPTGNSISYFIEAGDTWENIGSSEMCSYEMLSLEAPQITVTQTSPGVIVLSWEAVPGAIQYQLYYAGSDGVFSPFAMTDQLEHTLAASEDQVSLFKVTAISD